MTFSHNTLTPGAVQSQIAKGQFRPHAPLSNIAMAWFQDDSNYFASQLFPKLRVQLPVGSYYTFSKEDLLRDNWQRKPEHGSVTPATVSESVDTYSVTVDQMIMTLSDIRQTVQTRRQGPALKDPRQQHARTIAEQAKIHQDRIFANAFFHEGVWENEWTGVDSTTTGDKEFIMWDNYNSDPIEFIEAQKWKMFEQTGRMPNRLGIGVNVYKALRQHPAIKERVFPGGSTANPATVNDNVIRSLFEIEKMPILKSIWNQAKMGADANMTFIADPNAMLLCYATDNPAVEEPTAGYTISWDMLGDGQLMPIFHRKPNDARHVEEIEGLMAFGHKKTCDELAVFYKNVVKG